MGILRRLREWREDKNGTLIGPNIEADSVDAGSVNTNDLKSGSSLREQRGPFVDVADDSVVTFDFRSTISGNTFLYIYTFGSPAMGEFILQFDTITSGTVDSMSNEGSGSLSGTTGPDGTLNIGIDGTDVQLENRTGESIDIQPIQTGVEADQ